MYSVESENWVESENQKSENQKTVVNLIAINSKFLFC